MPLMENKLQDIYDYYKKETSLTQSELVMTMLTELQEVCGYLTEDMQKKTAEIAGVNNGYITALIKNLPHLHAQPFEHEIRVCISDRCKKKDGTEVLKKLQKILKVKPGQVTKDGKFMLNTEYCMHNCLHGPNIKIDGVLYQEVKAADIEKMIQPYMTSPKKQS